MKIMINGADADIRPENEKTLGEVLCVLDNWLLGSGYRLSGLNIDGEIISSNSMEEIFTKEIDTIDALDIRTSSLLELLAECYLNLIQDIDEYEAAEFNDTLFFKNWKDSPQACMLAEQSPELYDMSEKFFCNSHTSLEPSLRQIVLERLIELQDPVGELTRIKSIVTNTCISLEEVPLHLQTGKDAKAMEEMGAFSGTAEKVFRIINILKLSAFPIDEIRICNIPIGTYISEFDAALKEMLAAYERNDIILVGDIAEYEMAPRLLNLYESVFNNLKGE